MGCQLRNSTVTLQNSYREEFDSKLEWLIRSWLMNKRNFEALDFKLKVALVNEFYHREDFPEILIRNRSLRVSIVSGCFRFQRKLILSCSTVGDMTLVLRNIFLACRMLPLYQQREIYSNLDKLLRLIAESAKENGVAVFGSLDQLISNLFNFEALPLTYDESAKNKERHRFIFSKAIWESLPLILSSTAQYVKNVAIYEVFITKIWWTLKRPNFRSENWKKIVCRIAKSTESAFRPETPVADLKMILDSIETCLYPIEDLRLLIFTLISFKVEDENNSDYHMFQMVVDSFSDRTEFGLNTQLLLSSVLVRVPKEVWKPRHLPFVRQIKRTSEALGKKLLLVAYKSLAQSSSFVLSEENAVDIVQGLEEDFETWFKIVTKFRNKPGFPYDAFYTPVKAFMYSFVESQETNTWKFRDICKIFAELLLMMKSASSEDWDLILTGSSSMFMYTFHSLLIKLVLKIPVLEMSEETMRHLTKTLLSTTENLPSLLLALTKIAEFTKEPESLAISSLEHLKFLDRENRFPRSSFPYIEVLRFVYILTLKAQTERVHEEAIVYLSRVLTLWLLSASKRSLDSDSALKLVSHVIRANLCKSQVYSETCASIFSEIDSNLPNVGFYPEDRFNLLLILYELNPSKVFETETYRLTHWSVLMANLCFAHKAKLRNIEAEEFMKISRALIFKSRWEGQQATFKAKIVSQIIIIIKEFHQEPYFDQIFSLIMEEISNEKNFLAILRPRLLLSDALRAKHANKPVSSNILFKGSCWPALTTNVSEAVRLAYHGLINDEKQEIIELVTKLFFDGTLNEQMATIAVSLYFMNQESFAESFTVSLLVQLARLR
jgi:hypothetical protein